MNVKIRNQQAMFGSNQKIIRAGTVLRVARGLLAIAVFALTTSTSSAREGVEASAADPFAGTAVSGAIGVSRHPQSGSYPNAGLLNTIQPVEISGPVGMDIAIETATGWSSLRAAPLRMGLVVGRPYRRSRAPQRDRLRLRVAGAAVSEGQELFPSICILAKLQTPPGTAWRFPVEILIDQNDIEVALAGAHVQRIVYAPSDSDRPDILPSSWFDVRPGDDCFEVAATLGEPVAEIRIGNRLPAPGVVP